MKRRARLLVVARSANEKTGDVPTVWVGRDAAEARASCTGCPRLAGGCYAQHGTPRIAISGLGKSAKRDPARYATQAGLKARSRRARVLRVAALGDPARAHRGELRVVMRAARAAGLGVIGYTHFWSGDGADLREQLLASCESPAEAERANAAGWRAALVMPTGTTGTLRRADGSILAVECPATAAARMGKRYTCNDCGSGRRGALCDATVPGPNVYFAEHGQAARRRLPVLG
jgi:hypothetical protein